MNNRRIIFIALMFLATIVACIVPGLSTTSAPDPAPTVDTGQIEAMVAETVTAVIAQTEQAQPTSTSEATVTITSMDISTATPTSTISTPAPTLVTSSPDSTLTVQVDASTVFVDERAGYQLTLPAAWLIMRINGQEYLDAKDLAEAADTNVQKSLQDIQKESPYILRLFAIDAQEGHIQNEFVTNIKFIWDEKNAIPLENNEALKASADQLAKTITGLEVLSTKTITTANKILIGLIESKSKIKNSSGADVTVFQKQAVFNVGTGKMTITLTTVEDLKGTLFPIFDAMIGTIKLSGGQS